MSDKSILNVVVDNNITMGSLEIAELTNKLHKHVCRDIRNMMAKLDIQPVIIGCPTVDTTEFKGVSASLLDNGMVREYRLDRTRARTLVTGYDTVTRHNVMLRLDELEKKQTQPTTELGQCMMMLTKRTIATEDRVDELSLRVGALEKLEQKPFAFADNGTHVVATELAAMYCSGMKARELNQILVDQHFQRRAYTATGIVKYTVTAKGAPYAQRRGLAISWSPEVLKKIK